MLFDVSLSMEADDVDPTRFAAAQEAARDFVDQVDPNVEVGLISFSGEVNVDVDPTLDRSSDGQRDRQPGTGRVDRHRRRARRRDPTARRIPPTPNSDVAPGVMVLLSDGETTVGRLTSDGAQDAADAGIPVYTIAFGTEDRASSSTR